MMIWLALIAFPIAAQGPSDVPASSEPHVYELDVINPGLPQPAELLDLETPQALFESLMDAGHAEEWDRVATALDLSDLSVSEQAARGPELARQAFDIVNRSILIDWRGLSDRPDAVEVIASDKEPLAGEPRRSIVLTHLRADGRDYSFRIARLKTPNGEPVWMISRQTVENIPALYERYGPSKFEKSLPPQLRKQAFWTLAWWEVISLPVVLILALMAAALVYAGIRRFRENLDEERLAHSIARAIHLPASLTALAGTFALLRSSIFNFSGTVASILDPLEITLFVAAIGALILVIIETIIDFASGQRTRELEDPDNEEARDYFTKLAAGQRIITVFVVLIAAAVVLIQTDIASTLGFSLLASAGVLGLILVFAARQALGDLMASIQIAFAKTARIGDAVYWQGQWCYIERIGFTHLRLRTWDERRLMAPVAAFIGESFENWTKTDPSLMTHVELMLDHRADIDRLREEFQQFVENDDAVMDAEEAEVQVVGHDAQAMTVRFLARAEDPKAGWKLQCRVREHILAAIGKMDASDERTPVFLPREREVQVAQQAS
ncbi:mechanosensitive ion channel family protein [Erythrobacter ani]|uniref:Mechanosensitive ion channel n=1 Tax=Erythrobacter ani TaxID=2827235 RepID=A0ABS6SNM9_9SPHN|nr:mechanosensitive ion channel domain-containing protein [Erythrobacter ani]MBV7266594.1 mechanosensitive ion channel [Erythrobacter ani]